MMRSAPPDLTALEVSMTFVIVISREPRTRSAVTEYLRQRGYDTATAESYDHAMELLPGIRPEAIVADVQGVPRGEEGTNFAQFNQWLPSTHPTAPPRLCSP